MSANHDEAGRPNIRTFRADQIFGIMWLFCGIVVVVQSLKLEYLAEYGPGPGFLPFWLGVGVIIFGVALFFNAILLTKKDETIEIPVKHAAFQLILVIAAIFAFILMAETIGFIISIGLLFFFVLFIVERRGWKISIIMAVVSPLIIWIIFEKALEMRLPPGILTMFQ